MLLSVAYPNLSETDAELIRDFRRINDLAYVNVVEPHWTMIFPGSTKEVSREQLSKHIAEVATGQASIEFTCRYALVYDDDSNDDYYLFLVPDEGFSQISRMHDQLYSGFMRPHLRLDIPYVPHIGVATGKDPNQLYELASEWNKHKREISGVIDRLSLCSYDGRKVVDLEEFGLNCELNDA